MSVDSPLLPQNRDNNGQSLDEPSVVNNNHSVPLTTNATIVPMQHYSEENSPKGNKRNRIIVKNKKKSVQRCVPVSIVIILIAVIGIFIFVIIKTRVKAHGQDSEHITTEALHNQSSKDSLWTNTDVRQQAAKKVLFIIADGIPADVIENATIPNIKKIFGIGGYTRAYVGGENGTYTETATISAPGYISLVTGTWGNKHNVFDNAVQNPNYHYKNIFRLVKEQEPDKKIGIFSTWIDNRVKLIGEGLVEAGNITFDYKFDGYELDDITYPHDAESIYIYNIDERVTNETSRCIETYGPDLSWVYLQYTDDIGHSFGDSQQLSQAVTYLDNQIGRIWKAIDYRMKTHQEDWLIIITTDHGRDPTTGREHGDQSERERTTWIVTNSQETNSYFRHFQPGIVDILPTIARFMGLTVPIESERELDGIPLTGKVSLIKPGASLNGDQLTISWQVGDHEGNVTVWLSTTNLFQVGLKDNYKLIGIVPIDNQMARIDIKEYPSKFYKIVLEGQHNMVNKWVFRT